MVVRGSPISSTSDPFAALVHPTELLERAAERGCGRPRACYIAIGRRRYGISAEKDALHAADNFFCKAVFSSIALPKVSIVA